MINKTALYLFLLPVIFAGCKSKCVDDLGIHVTRDRQLKPFNEIGVSGPLRLVMRQDSSFKVSVTADSAAIDLVSAVVKGDRLELSMDKSKYCGKDSVIINAGIGALKKITAKGAGHIYTSSAIHVGELELDLSGATQLMMEVNAAKLITSTDGAASLTFIGQTGSHQLKIKGALQMNAFAFVAGGYDINSQGVSKLQINVLNDLKIKTSGSSDISYKGSPKNISENKNGTYKLTNVN